MLNYKPFLTIKIDGDNILIDLIFPAFHKGSEFITVLKTLDAQRLLLAELKKTDMYKNNLAKSMIDNNDYSVLFLYNVKFSGDQINYTKFPGFIDVKIFAWDKNSDNGKNSVVIYNDLIKHHKGKKIAIDQENYTDIINVVTVCGLLRDFPENEIKDIFDIKEKIGKNRAEVQKHDLEMIKLSSEKMKAEKLKNSLKKEDKSQTVIMEEIKKLEMDIESKKSKIKILNEQKEKLLIDLKEAKRKVSMEQVKENQEAKKATLLTAAHAILMFRRQFSSAYYEKRKLESIIDPNKKYTIINDFPVEDNSGSQLIEEMKFELESTLLFNKFANIQTFLLKMNEANKLKLLKAVYQIGKIWRTKRKAFKVLSGSLDEGAAATNALKELGVSLKGTKINKEKEISIGRLLAYCVEYFGLGFISSSNAMDVAVEIKGRRLPAIMCHKYGYNLIGIAKTLTGVDYSEHFKSWQMFDKIKTLKGSIMSEMKKEKGESFEKKVPIWKNKAENNLSLNRLTQIRVRIKDQHPKYLRKEHFEISSNSSFVISEANEVTRLEIIDYLLGGSSEGSIGSYFVDKLLN